MNPIGPNQNMPNPNQIDGFEGAQAQNPVEQAQNPVEQAQNPVEQAQTPGEAEKVANWHNAIESSLRQGRVQAGRKREEEGEEEVEGKKEEAVEGKKEEEVQQVLTLTGEEKQRLKGLIDSGDEKAIDEITQEIMNNPALLDVEITPGGSGVFHHAAFRGKLDMFKTLSNLYFALKGKNYPVNTVRDTDNATPLILAASQGRYDMVNYLLEDSNIYINAVDNLGSSAFYLAAQNDLREICKLLLDKGANPNLMNQDGSTGLEMLCRTGSVETIKLFIDRGTDVNLSNTGWGPLAMAVFSRNMDAVKFLLKNGANVDGLCVDKAVIPLVIAAVDESRKEIFDVLIEGDADMHKAYEFAKKEGLEEVMKKIEEYMGCNTKPAKQG